jgi:hypothetical protein
MLEVHDSLGLKGTLTRTGTTIQGSNRAMQDLADQSLRNAGDDLDEAWEHLRSINNGYAWTTET